MNDLNKWIPDLEYRVFMQKLPQQITAQDMAELKYVLTSLIPEGKKESLKTASQLFDFLEHLRFVEENNLGNLKELFVRMDKKKLCQMVGKFMRDGTTRTIQSSTETATIDGLNKWIPDLEYRVFMLKLSRQITAQDMEQLKRVLSSLIPEGKKESLKTALELFRYLEMLLFVETNNLAKLKEVFRIIDKPILCEMITKFIRDGNIRTVESFTEYLTRMFGSLVYWILALLSGH